jgi:hypothetical protein
MRTALLISLLLAATFCGCKTTHIALTHPGLGVHVVAKFESYDEQFGDTHFADHQLADSQFAGTAALRR